MEKVAKLLEWQPTATNILYAGVCTVCEKDGILFYQLPEQAKENPDAEGWIEGAYYCSHCEFSNAGALEITREDG
jgi:hypothetical protein